MMVIGPGLYRWLGFDREDQEDLLVTILEVLQVDRDGDYTWARVVWFNGVVAEVPLYNKVWERVEL